MTKISKRDIAKNSGFLYIRMVVMMLISLYTSRIILLQLDEVDFGVYGIVWSAVSLFSFFNLSMTTASRRCLSFELGKGKDNQYSQVLGSLIRYSLIVGIIIFVLQEVGGLYLLENKLNIPSNRKDEALISYHIFCGTFFLSVIQIPFSSSLISQEKIKTFSSISILDSIIKLLLVLTLSFIAFDKLIAYSFILLAQQIIVLVLFSYFSLRKSGVSFKRSSNIDNDINKYLGWNTLGGLSSVGLNQGIQLLINLFFSPVVNAAQTIATQVRSSVENFTSNIRVSFNPPIIKSCAMRDDKETIELLSFSVRFSSVAVLLVTVPLIAKLDFILELWLVNPPAYTSILCLLFLINSIIDNVSTPMVSIIQAKGDIRKYQILTSIVLLSILPVSYFFYKFGAFPEIYGYCFILSSILILFIRIVFLRQVVTINTMEIIKLISTQIIVAPVLTLLIPLTLAYFMNDTILDLFIIVLLSIIIVIIVSWFIIIQPKEKKMIVDYLKQKANR